MQVSRHIQLDELIRTMQGYFEYLVIYIILYYIILYYITLHYITLHYITLHYITLHYITLHYIILHYSKISRKGSVDTTKCFFTRV